MISSIPVIGVKNNVVLLGSSQTIRLDEPLRARSIGFLIIDLNTQVIGACKTDGL
jgi:hypothetical protein